MPTKILKSVKGRRLRITRLNAADGSHVVGDCSSVVTDGFVQVTLSAELEAGEEISLKNAWGTYCVQDKDGDLIKWVNVGIQLCAVDPDVLDMTAGANPVITAGGDTIGATFGQLPNPDAFAVEVWTKNVDNTAENGYFVVPLIKNGKLDGDIVIQNDALTVDIVGEGFPATDAWGVTPYNDNPLLTTLGFPENDLFGYVTTTVAPPAVTAGCQPLAV